MSLQFTAQATSQALVVGSASAERLGQRQKRRESFSQLTRALEANDLVGARSAYASLLESAPAVASWRPDSALAQLGQALTAGDLQAAQTSFDRVLA